MESWYAIGEVLSFVSPYFCGVALGFFMVIIDEKYPHFALKQWQYFGLVAVSGFTLLSLVMWPYADVRDAPEERWSVAANSWYVALEKTAWGVALSMLSFAMRYLDEKSGQGSLIKGFLSVEIWQPLQKLTFLLYMSHPIIARWYLQDFDTPFYYSIWNAMMYLAGMVTVTFMLVFFLYFFMEQPISLFISAVMKKLLSGAGQAPKTVSLKRQPSRIVREMKHHPSAGAGFVDVEESHSSTESATDSEIDDETDDENGDQETK